MLSEIKVIFFFDFLVFSKERNPYLSIGELFVGTGLALEALGG